MTRAIAAMGLAAFAVGCAQMRIRDEAHTTLSCPKDQIRLEQKRPDTWLAEGCGRAAICQYPPDAEVQCIGGGPVPPKGALPSND